MATVNGEQMEVSGLNIYELLEKLEYNINRIVVELNYEIVPKDTYDTVVLKENDIVEIVTFMGGGAYMTKSCVKNGSADLPQSASEGALHMTGGC